MSVVGIIFASGMLQAGPASDAVTTVAPTPPPRMIARGEIHPIAEARIGTLTGGVVQSISVEVGHDIDGDARERVLQRHRVLNLMTHVDPWRRPDLNHPEPTAAAGP